MQTEQILSFKICPFLFGTLALALHKRFQFDSQYVNVNKLPEWFVKISTSMKVSVMELQQIGLFECCDTMEYVDQVTLPNIQIHDSKSKSLNRDYYDLSKLIYGILQEFMNSQTSQVLSILKKYIQTFYSIKKELQQILQLIEDSLQENSQYLEGDAIQIADFLFALIFIQIQFIEKYSQKPIINDLPKVLKYSQNLLNLPAVQNAIPDDFKKIQLDMHKKSFYCLIGYKPLLISHSLCPYVQRVRMFMNLKQIDHDLKFVDVKNKPDWFKEISPLGKVPVLQIENIIINESNVILEYLDELQEFSIFPYDPLSKAEARSWMEFSNVLQQECSLTLMTKITAKIPERIEKIKFLLSRLDKRLSSENLFFLSNDIGINDVVLAPSMFYIKKLGEILELEILENYNKVKKYSQVLLSQQSFQNALPQGYNQLIQVYLSESAIIKAKL